MYAKEVRQRLGDICNVTLWRWIKAGKIPAPRILGSRNTWTDTELNDVLENLPRRQYRDNAGVA
jgi:predicted site-specific integrase-resolvase